MNSGLELYGSRVSHMDFADDTIILHFPHAYIHRSKGYPGRDTGTGWSQEVRLVMRHAAMRTGPPTLPNNILDGYAEVGGRRQEILPLPFEHKVTTTLWLRFEDGSELEIVGGTAAVEQLGQPIYLEDLP